MRAILDASAIIAFFEELASHRTLLLLRELGYTLCVPAAVQDDILREPSASLLSECMTEGGIERLNPMDHDRLAAFHRSHPALGLGESEVILNALEFRETGEVVCVLDERPGRRVAVSLGLPVMGTVGILNRLRDANLITESEDNRLRERLRASSFRVGEGLL